MKKTTGAEATFGPESRLADPEVYRKIFRSTQRYRDGFFISRALPNNTGYARLGLSISRKCISGAVQRNRIKRLIRESFRKNKPHISGLDIFMMTHKNPVALDNKAISTLLDKHWQKLAICKN